MVILLHQTGKRVCTKAKAKQLLIILNLAHGKIHYLMKSWWEI